MKRRVVCISRTLGAGGEEVGRLAADTLGFRYADREIIMRAADSVGVSAETVSQAERAPGLVDRILGAMAKAPVVDEGYALIQTYGSPSYERLIEEVLRQTASEGNVVIVAHGGSIALAGTDGLLRVLVTASPDVRARRVADASDLDERQADDAVQESDRQRRDYLRRFYDVPQELPTHYDFVLNTDALTPQEGARLVAAAAEG